MTDKDECLDAPAFPIKGGIGEYQYEGMSLRDWFAGQALAGMGVWTPTTHVGGNLSLPTNLKARAEWAYSQADAMLRQRCAQTPTGEPT